MGRVHSRGDAFLQIRMVCIQPVRAGEGTEAAQLRKLEPCGNRVQRAASLLSSVLHGTGGGYDVYVGDEAA